MTSFEDRHRLLTMQERDELELWLGKVQNTPAYYEHIIGTLIRAYREYQMIAIPAGSIPDEAVMYWKERPPK